MKTANVLIFVGVMISGLIAGSAPLHAQAVDEPNMAGGIPLRAQSVDEPNMAGGENMPWNKGVTEETRTAARTVFLEGNRLFKIPLFSQAVEKYTEAISKWRHPAFYFNLAIAEINLGDYLDARENLEEALKYGPDPLREDRYEEAKKQLVEVEHHLGKIRVSCPTPGAEVTLDGVTLFTGPGSQVTWVKPQPHEVAAKQQDYAPRAKRVTVAAGTIESVDLPLRKIFEDRPWAVWKPWALVGAGAVIAAASGVLHGVSAHDFKTYDSGFVKLNCAAMGCTQQQIDMGDPRLSPRLNRARLEQTIAVGGYITGGVAIAAGVVLVYLNRPHLLEQEDTNAHTTGVALVPVISADMVGALVTVSH